MAAARWSGNSHSLRQLESSRRVAAAPSPKVGSSGGAAIAAAMATQTSSEPAASGATDCGSRRVGRSLGFPSVAAGNPLGHVGLRWGVRLDPDGLGRDPYVHVIGPHVFGGNRIRADHRVSAYPYPGQYGGVIGNPHVVLQDGACVGDVFLVHDAVGMTVDVGVI